MQSPRPSDTDPPRAAAGGFTLMELLVTLTIISMLFALIVPNLGAFVPTARLQGSGKQLRAKIDWARSEARIRGQHMTIELDLDRARWRILYPPELRLTMEDDGPQYEDYAIGGEGAWNQLEKSVLFRGAGDARNGIARSGLYQLRFDEYGFSNDQLVILGLDNEPDKLWSLMLRGLTGVTDVIESETGNEPELPLLGEGAF